jgi:hypothetical protein
MLYLLLFHCNNCYTNAFQCYVIRTLPILFDLVTLSKYTSCPKSPILILKVHHMIIKAARICSFLKIFPYLKYVYALWNCLLHPGLNPRRKRLHWVLFCDESTCQVLGHVKHHNVKTCGTENPLATHKHIPGNPKINAFLGGSCTIGWSTHVYSVERPSHGMSTFTFSC